MKCLCGPWTLMQSISARRNRKRASAAANREAAPSLATPLPPRSGLSQVDRRALRASQDWHLNTQSVGVCAS